MEMAPSPPQAEHLTSSRESKLNFGVPSELTAYNALSLGPHVNGSVRPYY